MEQFKQFTNGKGLFIGVYFGEDIAVETKSHQLPDGSIKIISSNVIGRTSELTEVDKQRIFKDYEELCNKNGSLTKKEQLILKTMNTKDEFIAVLKKQEYLKNALNEIYKQRDAINEQLNSCNNDIDLIFAKVQSSNYSLYSKMFVDGRNEAIARFEMDGEIIEITRNMGYENPIDRIMVNRKPMLS